MRLKSLIPTAVIMTSLLAGASAARADGGFAWLTIAPEMGYVHFFKTTLDEEFDVKLGARNGLTVKGHVDIGGDGLALEVAPLYSWQSAGGTFGSFSALGGELTLVYRSSFKSFYPGIGVGLHLAGIFANDIIKSGLELYARVPVGFTWYFAKHLGLVFEAGAMFGGTGIRMKEQSGASLEEQEINALANTGDIYWGPGFGFDIMAGLRFP